MMPAVSPFSSSHLVRHHGQLIARWNSSRARIDADEQRRDMREMQELDGTGLYEREDWPLPSPPSPTAANAVEHVGRNAAIDLQEGRVEDGAVLRTPEEISGFMSGAAYYEEDLSNVSDMDDDEDDDEEHVQRQSAASSVQHRPSSDEQPSPPSSTTLSHTAVLSRDLPSPKCETEAEVSPVRQDQTSSLDRELLDDREHHLQSRPTPITHAEELNGDEAEDADDLEESRDIATAIPFGPDSPESRQGPFQPRSSYGSYSSSTHGSLNITPTSFTNGVNHRSSIAKGPMHRTSARSSWYSTTQIPYQKERVRYSWQSVQDDQPNRPRIHIIKLISNVATASAGFPTGEAFGFSISPGGRRIAAFNSSRLYVLQTNALPVGISQDFALKRRPLAVELLDEGYTMAVLADDHTVNIYELGLHLSRTRTIKLDFPSNCIALAPTGGLLAAGFEGGVEVFSLAPDALPTDRRAVRSVRMDRLCFSDDGSTLLGTTTRINIASTVVVQVPVFPSLPNGKPTHEELKEAWCSELLHPEHIRNSSHAAFMQENRKTCNDRLFAWNGLEDTFGVLNVSDMQYGTTDFPVVISPPLSTCGGLGAAIHSCPAVNEHADTVAMIVNDRTIRLYIVPPKADGDEATAAEAHSIDHELDEAFGCPFHEARWVYSSSSLPAPLQDQAQVKGRLIVTSPGGVTESGISDESVEDIEGGRIIMFDFDPQFAGQPGQMFSLTLGKSPPQFLEEEQVNVAEQVALVRRRTVNQSKSGGLTHHRPAMLGRSATTSGRRDLRAASPAFSSAGSNRNRNSMLSIGSMQSEGARSLPDLAESNEQTDVVLEEPYVQGAPRSQASLQRAATNAQRHRFQTLEERTQERVTADSTAGFLPLPEYSEEPNAPLPSRYRAMAGLDGPAVFNAEKPSAVASASPNSTSGPSPSSAVAGPAMPDLREDINQGLPMRSAGVGGSLASRETGLSDRHETATSSSLVTMPHEQPRPGTAMSYVSSPVRERGDAIDSMSPVVSPVLGNGTYGSFRQPQRTGPVDSLAHLPRGLQRAYSNAVSPIGAGPPPALIGDWRNVSPTVGRDPYAATRLNGAMSPSVASNNRDDESIDVISPVIPSPQNSMPGQPYNRYSTSFANSPSHSHTARAPSSAGSFATMSEEASTPLSPGARRLPPHMQAMRNAAAANANTSASLFPPAQPPDHVPLRPANGKASTVAHPITAWHPPAASSTPPRRSGSRAHSRKSSLAEKSAFASTTKAKKLGFFKKSKRLDPYAPRHPNGQVPEGSSAMETKSTLTWMTKSDNKCSVM